MKKWLFITGIFFLAITTVKAQKVGADADLNTSLKKFKTYAWSKNINQIPSDKIFVGPNGVLVFNNESTRSKIKEAIQFELDARGYKRDPVHPDFIVTFSVTEQPADITTYNGYVTINGGLDKVRTPEDVQKTHLDAGTVLIDFIDAKTSKQVWQGYASGILKPDMINDQSKVRQAVASIFSKYRYKAGGVVNQ